MSVPAFPAGYRDRGRDGGHVTTTAPVVFLVDVDNTYRPADVTVERIGDLVTLDQPELVSAEVTT